MKLSGIKVLENEGGAVPNRTQRPQSETIAVNVYVGNGRRWSEGVGYAIWDLSGGLDRTLDNHQKQYQIR